MNTEFAANVKLMLAFDGENTSNNFIDYSNQQRIPIVNKHCEITTSRKRFGSGSGKTTIEFYPHLKYEASTDFDLNGDWTLDFFMYFDLNRPILTDEYFMSLSSNQYFRIDNTSVPRLHCNWLGVMGDSITGISGNLEYNRWYHFALVHKQNKEWYFYVNGELATSGVGDNSGGGGDE